MIGERIRVHRIAIFLTVVPLVPVSFDFVLDCWTHVMIPMTDKTINNMSPTALKTYNEIETDRGTPTLGMAVGISVSISGTSIFAFKFSRSTSFRFFMIALVA